MAGTDLRERDGGFMLLGAIVAIFLLLLTLSVAAPLIATSLRRDREVESTHRARQYVRAIQLYYLKFGHYPSSVEQLEKSNNIRFLRQKYDDPLTGQADWRVIKLGENKTKVKGFFGEDLPGLPGGLGSAAGMTSSTGMNGGGNTGGSGSSAFGGTSSFGGSGSGSGQGMGLGGQGAAGGFGGSSSGIGGTASSGSTFGQSTGSSGVASQSATDFKGGGGQMIGVGSAKTGDAIVVVNEMSQYQDWEFLYDPRIEQLKAKASLLGGIPTANSGGGFGNGNGLNGTNGTNGPGQNTFGGSGTMNPGTPSPPSGTTPR